MSYYQSGTGGYQNSAPANYQSQQYPASGGYYGYSPQQGQYGGAAPVRYPVGGAYQPQHQAYTPNQQMNKTMHSNAPNPFVNPRQPGSGTEYQQYPTAAGYGQDTSGYYPAQKSYQARPQSSPAAAYPYNYYSGSAPAAAHTGYMYGYTGNQSGQQQQQQQQPDISSDSGTPAESNITPQQQQAIQNWIVEKQTPVDNRGAGRGAFIRGAAKSRFGPAVGIQINKRFQRGFQKDAPRVANYFCEVCKVSCGTSDAYNTHLNGKSHKRKLSNPMPSVPSTGKLFKCDVCDVMCTGKDAFKAHIVGTKHKKVVKLYEVMGKPLPEIKDAPVGVDITTMGAHIQKTGRPLINFVKSSKELRMRGEDNEEDTSMSVDAEDTDAVLSSGGKKKPKPKRKNSRGDKPLARPLRVGLEGFTDAFGVPLHTISTRDVFVPPPRPGQWGWNGEQMERYYIETALRRNKYDDFSILDVHRKIYPSQKELDSLYGTLEDVEKSLNVISLKLHRELIEKFRESLQSTETEEQSMQVDEIKNEATAEEGDVNLEAIDAGNNGEEITSDSFVVQEKGDETHAKTDLLTQDQEDALRVIQGFQRVGDAAKGINLSGNLQAELIVICTEKPTKDLLQRIVDMMPATITDVTKFPYQVTPQANLAGFQVSYSEEEISVSVSVTLTSLDMREQLQEEEAKADENKGVLDRSCCQRALCQMRRTKWFQGQAICLSSYILIIRVLRDISRRVPAWTCLESWILELLLQKVISNCPREYTRPGDIIRSFIACIASGFFLPGAPGLLDPCEKDKVDASQQLTPQQREDLTFSAQHALRLISFKQLHKVLGLENAPRMQDIRDCTTPPRMHMRRFVPYRSIYRPKKKTPSVTDSSEKKTIVEESTQES